tara:strand:+ start:43 stop:603 length:561 start_codon:yes stop_codon:yes gene_type:complete
MEYKHSGGRVIWITGLSGAGKSTIAAELTQKLRQKGILPVVLDGDAIRAVINDENCGHDNISRLKNAYRISELARLAMGQGHFVVVATMSLFHEIHAWNRKNLPNYFEIFLDVSLETVKKRDPKNIYARALEGNKSNIPGIDLLPEFPLSPDLKINNDKGMDQLNQLVNDILDHCLDFSKQNFSVT